MKKLGVGSKSGGSSVVLRGVPTVAEKAPMTIAPKAIDKAQVPFEQFRLPLDVWRHHILSQITYSELSFFSQASRYTREVALNTIDKLFQSIDRDLDMAAMLRQAKQDGVKLNIPLIIRLCKLPNAGELFYTLLPEKNASWALAAISGDLQWLNDEYPDFYMHLETEPFDPPMGRPKSILYFFTMCDDLNIFEHVIVNTLERYADDIEYQSYIIRECNYIAGRVGNFAICDFLENKFGVLPDQRFENRQSTVHFYAYHGEVSRFKAALIKYKGIEKQPSDLTGYLIHDVVRGGHLAIFNLFMEICPATVTQLVPRLKKTCVHLAAEFGRAEILKRLITWHRLGACTPDANGLTPLHYSTANGRRECFNILLPSYEDHFSYEEIIASAAHQAVAKNHMDFFDQYVEEFGEVCINARTPNGTPLAHQLLESRNMRTAIRLFYDHHADLLAKNSRGEIAIVFIARMAIERKIPLWHFIVDFLNEFNRHFDNQLHLISDNYGNTLETLIIRVGKQALFPNLQFSSNSNALKP
jgi:hypothetical protein